MDDAENRTIRDPSADTCFLGGSIDELPPDPELPIEIQDDDVSIPPAITSSKDVESTGSAHGITRLKNPMATDATNKSIPALPSGEEIDSKNTLRSFHIPVNSGNDCDDRLFVTSTLSSFDMNVASNQPTLPSGEIIDSKNTLQSFNARAAVPVAMRAPYNGNINSTESAAGLPTAAAWIPPSQASDRVVPAAETVYEAELVTPTAPRRNIILFSVAFGIFAAVGASVIAGVCFSGNCGSFASDDPVNPEVESAVSAFVNDITYIEEDIFANGTSAESRALKWLIRGDSAFNTSSLLNLNSQIDNEVSFRVRQRYPLLILWFQRYGSNGKIANKWTNKTGWLEIDNECEWFGITCDANGSVTEVLFYNYATKVANGFVGSIPPDMGLLTSLRNFSMLGNNVTGTIPESIGQCSQMYAFSIQNCLVSGTIPSSLGQWTDLYSFDVSENIIAGSIPDTAENWASISVFVLVDNVLTGSIPSFIGQWSRLFFFSVGSNILTNTIPEEIGNLTNMDLFAVTTNHLSGVLPFSIGKMTALRYFLVDDNLLTGSIPSSVGNWSQIMYAYFESNNFTGTVPQEICNTIQVNDTVTVVHDCDVTCSCCTSCV
jgi:hypothetical protein